MYKDLLLVLLMKVFVEHDFSNIDVVFEYENRIVQKVIYSNSGVYTFIKDGFYKSIDLTTLSIVPFKTIIFLVEKGNITYGEPIYHIPFQHIYCEEVIYTKTIDTGIKFCKKEYLDQKEYYFEISGILESFMFAKMFSFLI
jgi:hypothetical protein